jgi:hypothetical protein
MNTTSFVDVGEKLGGARKDMWADFQRDADANTVAGLWPRPDWKKLIEETSPQLAATLYVIRETMIEHQKRSGAFKVGRAYDEETADLRRRYILGMRGALEYEAFESSIEGYARTAFAYAYVLATDGKDVTSFTDEVDEVFEQRADKIIAASGLVPRRRGMGYLRQGTASAIQALENDRREAERSLYEAYRSDGLSYGEYNKLQKVKQQQHQRKVRALDLMDDVERVLANGWPDVAPKKKRGRSLLIPRRPVLKQAEIRRIGPERPREIRTGEDVEKVFLTTFNIRGVEFGNYVPDNGERQLNANLAYHALLDLADVLGVEPHVVGRGRSGGGLGIGIGSRGKGAITGAAHYEPWSVVINLTRMMGDGSLAHEMGHKFDHGLSGYVFDREAIQEAKRAGADKSDLQKLIFPSERWTARPDRSPILETSDLNASFVAVMDAMMVEDITAERIKWTRYRQEAGKCLGRGRFGKSYWTAPCEMFARAFEAYVYDWLKERGRRNDYLAHGVGAEQFADASKYRGNPYPTGEERTRINAAMAGLIEVWRQT